MRIIPSWLREYVNVPADDRKLAEALTSAGIAVESVQDENGSTVYEMDLTTNRVDAMNHYGVAREASAIYDVELRKVEPKLPKVMVRRTAPPNISGPIGMTSLSDEMETVAESLNREVFPIVIHDAQGCARYTARIVRKVNIGPSPPTVIDRLALLGSRSINNVADATNYALNELGHPTHAFDLDLLEGGTIIVRRARPGEVLKTLDGVDRKLTTEDLVIADAKKPVALAGVMGGFDTMITERTRNVLIESAWFEPWTVRSMAKRHGMHTDASHRFERGADYDITPLACDRVAELILGSAGGELKGERIDAIGRQPQPTQITLRSTEVRRNLGIDIAEQQVERILIRLGFGIATADVLTSEAKAENPGSKKNYESGASEVSTASAVAMAPAPTSSGSSIWRVEVPSWRLDVEREIDLLEELARVYGYNRFPNSLPSFVGAVVELPDEAKNSKVRKTMLALGYTETISITFIAEQDAKGFAESEALALANPLSEEAGFMRTSLLPGLLTQAGYNLNRGNSDVRLFETGQVFEKSGDRHQERRRLGLAATGNVLPGTLHSAPQPYTFFHLKGDLKELLASFDYHSLQFEANAPAYLHPGRSARVVMDGETIAVFGQLHPEQAVARKLRQDVYLAEIMLDRLFRHALREPRYRRISKFPAVARDFSFVFDDGVTWEKVSSGIGELHISELINLRPGEIFRGEKVGAGKYSILIRAQFQSQERTLRDDEVAQWSSLIIGKLESLGGMLRAL
jgi:phenylalanyl-tRNA synthetase beta chain